MLRPSRVAIDETPCNSAAEGRTDAAWGPMGVSDAQQSARLALMTQTLPTCVNAKATTSMTHTEEAAGLAHRLDVLIALVDVEAQHPAREGDERAEPDDDDDRGQAEGGAE